MSRPCYMILAACLVVGCGQSASPMPVVDEKVSEAECLAFAKEFQAAVNNQDRKKIADSISWPVMASRAVAEVRTSKRTRESLRQGFVSSASSPDSTFVHEMVAAGKDFEFLRLRREDDKFRPMFRVFTDGGVNYFELYPFRSKSGKILAADIYVYATSECMSETVRRLFVTMLPPSQIEGGKAADIDEFAGTGKTFTQITQALQQAKAEECLRLIATLPAKVQDDKAILLTRVRASAMLSDDKYLEAMERFQKVYPKDPAGDMLSIDLYVLRKDLPKFEQAMKRLDERVGGDPFLHVLSAGSFIVMGEYERALSEADAGVKKTNSAYARWAKVRALAVLKRYREAADDLQKLEKDTNVVYECSEDDMKGFKASKEFKAMRASK